MSPAERFSIRPYELHPYATFAGSAGKSSNKLKSMLSGGVYAGKHTHHAVARATACKTHRKRHVLIKQNFINTYYKSSASCTGQSSYP